jgi:hypothetical protein
MNRKPEYLQPFRGIFALNALLDEGFQFLCLSFAERSNEISIANPVHHRAIRAQDSFFHRTFVCFIALDARRRSRCGTITAMNNSHKNA